MSVPCSPCTSGEGMPVHPAPRGRTWKSRATGAGLVRSGLPSQVTSGRMITSFAGSVSPRGAMHPSLVDSTSSGYWEGTGERSGLRPPKQRPVTILVSVHGTPMIVTRRLNPVTAYLLGPIVYMNTKDFSLVNIVAGKRIMPEYYQARRSRRSLRGRRSRSCGTAGSRVCGRR